MEVQKLMSKVFSGLETIEKLKVLKIIRSEISDFNLFFFFNGAKIEVEKNLLKIYIPCEYRKKELKSIFNKSLKNKLSEFEIKFYE
jgi:hypothetical protein